MKRPLEFGEARTRLYLLEFFIQNPKKFSSATMASLCSQKQPSCLSVFSSFKIPVRNATDVRLCHLKLGHIPFSAMKNVCSKSMSPFHFDSTCNICPLARQSRLPFSSSEISSKNIFELIHIDTWGPYKVSTHDGHRYFLTIVEDYSRGTWIYLPKAKNNALYLLKCFLALV